MTPEARNELRRKAEANALQYALHALRRMEQRQVSAADVRLVLATGQVVEDYPDDRFGASCLLLGRTAGNRPLHVVCSYPQRPLVKIITVYEPDPAEWQPGFTNRKPAKSND